MKRQLNRKNRKMLSLKTEKTYSKDNQGFCFYHRKFGKWRGNVKNHENLETICQWKNTSLKLNTRNNSKTSTFANSIFIFPAEHNLLRTTNDVIVANNKLIDVPGKQQCTFSLAVFWGNSFAYSQMQMFPDSSYALTLWRTQIFSWMTDSRQWHISTKQLKNLGTDQHQAHVFVGNSKVNLITS